MACVLYELGPAPRNVNHADCWLPPDLRGKAYRGVGLDEAQAALRGASLGAWWSSEAGVAVSYARMRHANAAWLLIGELTEEDVPLLKRAESLYGRPARWVVELVSGRTWLVSLK